MSLAKKFMYSGFSSSGFDFIIVVNTAITGTGTVSATNQYQLATTDIIGNYTLIATSGGTVVNFGSINGGQLFTFPFAGVWEMRFTPAIFTPIRRFTVNNLRDRNKLITVKQWGRIVWETLNFWGCNNLDVTAEDTPIFASVPTVVNLFRDCISLTNANSSLSSWNTQNITSFLVTFRNTQNFNKSLNNWNTSNVTTMNAMFDVGSIYNQSLNSLDVSNVSNFTGMFFLNAQFNQYLGDWQLRLAGTNLSQIFRNSGMNTANYTDTIVGWANYVFENGAPFSVNMATQTGRTFTNSRSGGANFANAGAARTYLTTTAGWTISGDTVI